jgi:diguanylate cyclase (GGDEF)-like protein
MTQGLEPKNSIAILVFVADYLEGPETAFVGIVTSLPLMAAIFGGPRSTAFVGVVVFAGAYLHGLTTADGNSTTQLVRLGFIAFSGSLAVLYSWVRTKRERERVQLFVQNLNLEAASELALFDQLTNILNRRGVLEKLADDARWPRTVVLFDLDKLKDINDNHGHQIGDEFIRTIAERLHRAIAPGDILGRWGGDEFILIFPLAQEQAKAVTERVIQQVSTIPIGVNGASRLPRVSAGVAEWSVTHTLEQSISLADEALYQAKHQGGNCVVTSTVTSV